VGDAVLIAFAGLLQRSSRPGETAARWGGEEFIWILPGHTERAAVERVAAVVDACSAECVGAFPDGSEQTVSAGIAAWADFPKVTNEALVKAADNALYQAKRDGRNQYATASGRPNT
jgi:diguanylate cyclase (GGDEF)-like protein